MTGRPVGNSLAFLNVPAVSFLVMPLSTKRPVSLQSICRCGRCHAHRIHTVSRWPDGDRPTSEIVIAGRRRLGYTFVVGCLAKSFLPGKVVIFRPESPGQLMKTIAPFVSPLTAVNSGPPLMCVKYLLTAGERCR